MKSLAKLATLISIDGGCHWYPPLHSAWGEYRAEVLHQRVYIVAHGDPLYSVTGTAYSDVVMHQVVELMRKTHRRIVNKGI